MHQYRLLCYVKHQSDNSFRFQLPLVSMSVSLTALRYLG